MIRTIFSFIFILLSSYTLYGQAYRDRMRNAIDVGTHTEPFVYTNTVNSGDYTNDYSCPEDEYFGDVPANDIFYKIALTRSMDITFKHTSSSFSRMNIHILDNAGKELQHRFLYSSGSDKTTISFFPGIYYIIFEPAPEYNSPSITNGPTTAHIEGKNRVTGEDFFYPFVVGSFNSDFTISPTVARLTDYVLDYNLTGDPDIDYFRHDVVHQFTITQPMEVTMDNCGTSFNEENHFRSTLMSSLTDSVSEVYSSYACGGQEHRYELTPGTYYIYSWGDLLRYPYTLVINLQGKRIIPGSDFLSPTDMGSYSAGFNYTHTYDTNQSIRSKLSGKSGKEAFYRLTLTSPMELNIDNCGSSVADTYLSVYSSDMKLLYSNDDYSGSGACSNTKNARIHIPALLPGTYYIVTDGSTNGNVTTTVHGYSLGQIGDRMITAIDAGSHDGGFVYTDTRNTSSGYTNQFSGKPTNDVFYKLTLKQPADLLVSHCGSVIADTYLSILNSAGTVLYSNDNYTGEEQCNSTGNALIKVNSLAAGTYYVVSEGNSQNGSITTNIRAYGVNGSLSTTKGQPHVISFIPTVASDNVLTLGTDKVRHEVQYYDYFGNPTVKVQHGFSPYGDDLFTLQEYDGLNRETNLWLPVTKGGTNGEYVNPGILKEAAKMFQPYGLDKNPFNRKVYDKSPLNEVVEQYGPGEDWHSGLRSVATDRMTNLNVEDARVTLPMDVTPEHLIVRMYKVTDSGLSSTGIYTTASLDVTQTTNEDGNISYEFKDKLGHSVLTRQVNGDELHDTYMVYDGYGNIRFVLPPLAADGLASNSSWTETNDILKKYAYIYHYDKYNRCIYKKLPGCEPVYTIYDAADRPIFVQDGNQRDKGEWSFSLVDAFNRVVLTGTCKNTFNYTADPLKDIIVKATWVKQTNTLKGYSVPKITLTTPTVLTANYYDNYEFVSLNGIPDTIPGNSPTRYELAVGYGKRYYGGCKGQQTGIWTARLSKNGVETNFLYSVMYYDERYRIIQQKGNNELNGTDQIYTAYNFNGQPTQVKQIRTAPGKETMTELRTHTYDNADRLLKTTYQLNNLASVILVDNVYDEVGRLKTERRNGNAKLKTDYAYNIRSWTKSITGSLFNQTLNYQESISGNTPCFNGNISSMLWKTGSETSERGYRFTYDNLSRLKDAVYGESTTLATSMNRFNEQITGYDKMGNILGLKRYGQIAASNYGLIDNLTLTYNGNQLQAVRDLATNSVYGNGMEFKDGANQTVEYTYDKNGNLIKDLNKNISSIGYNLLNLPNQVIFTGGNSVEYEYKADGTKLRTVHKTGTTTLTTDYCGNAIYENGVLKMLLNEVGYVSFPDKRVHFYLKDHQGNTRVVADKDGTIDETNAYYPFGGTYTSATNVQPYKYNGKELDTKNGLNWYDYGARYYDAALGRWHVVDPMAKKYYSASPYVYSINNPVNCIDPDGKDVAILIAEKGAGGYGHMAAVIQDKKGNFYYVTVGNTDGRAATFSGVSSGAGGGMALEQIQFNDKEANMQNAIEIAKNDKNNSTYTDNVILKTSSKMDDTILKSAKIMKQSFESGDTKYNVITNNCADAIKTIIKKGTGVGLPMGISSKPNENFKEIKKHKDEIQTDINKKIEDEK